MPTGLPPLPSGGGGAGNASSAADPAKPGGPDSVVGSIPPAGGKGAKLAPPPLGRVLGNRDWILYVDCRAEGVVLKRRRALYTKHIRPGVESRDWLKRRFEWD